LRLPYAEQVSILCWIITMTCLYSILYL
jgi:hypothetical protein